MTTRHNAKPRADSDRRPYGELFDAAPVRPEAGLYANPRAATNSHVYDDRDTTETNRDQDGRRSHDRDQESENEPQLSRNAPRSEPQTSYGNHYLPQRTSRFSGEEGDDVTTELPPNSVPRSLTGRRREDTTDSEDGDEDLEPIMCFVPGEDLDLMVLEHYIKKYVDKIANVRPSHHPTDKSRTGFTVTAKQSLSAATLRDVRNDSRDWQAEKQTKEFRRRLRAYSYRESQTAQRRARKGPSEIVTTRPQTQPRPRQETMGMTRAHPHIERATSAPQTGYTPAAYNYQMQDQSYTSSAHYAIASGPQYTSGTNQPRSESSPVIQYASTPIQRYVSDPEPMRNSSAAPYPTNRTRYGSPTSSVQYSPYQNMDVRYDNTSGQPQSDAFQ